MAPASPRVSSQSLEAMGFLTSLAIFSGDGWLDITTNQIHGKDCSGNRSENYQHA